MIGTFVMKELGIHKRLLTILKARDKGNEAMFLICKSLYIPKFS